MHSKVFKKVMDVMLAVPLDYLTRDQYVMCKRKKQTCKEALRELRGIALRMRAIISMT